MKAPGGPEGSSYNTGRLVEARAAGTCTGLRPRGQSCPVRNLPTRLIAVTSEGPRSPPPNQAGKSRNLQAMCTTLRSIRLPEGGTRQRIRQMGERILRAVRLPCGDTIGKAGPRAMANFIPRLERPLSRQEGLAVIVAVTVVCRAQRTDDGVQGDGAVVGGLVVHRGQREGHRPARQRQVKKVGLQLL
jgi:hypothetical protein